MDLPLQLGARVRYYRMQAGLTQQELADAIGTARTTISQIERGHMDIRVSALQLMARTMGVTPEQLMPDKTPEDPEFESRRESLLASLRSTNDG